MAVSLESLELTPEALEAARDAVRKAAYVKWEEAGKPACDGSQFWSDAEREWIERCYVPPRLPEASLLSRPSETPAAAPRKNQPRQQPVPAGA